MAAQVPQSPSGSSSSFLATDICAACKNLFLERRVSDSSTYGAFKASAEAGCDQCQLIVDLVFQCSTGELAFNLPRKATNIHFVSALGDLIHEDDDEARWKTEALVPYADPLSKDDSMSRKV
jgi:hypothetical protein